MQDDADGVMQKKAYKVLSIILKVKFQINFILM